MDKPVLDEQLAKLKSALGEHAARALDGNNELSARIAEIRDALGEVIDKATSERAKSVGLADMVKERLKSLEESIPQGPTEEDKERLSKLEKSLGERTDELNASKKRIAQLDKSISEQAEAAQHSAQKIADLEKEIMDRNDAAQAAKHRMAQLEKDAETTAAAGEGAKQRVEKLEKALIERSEIADAARNRVEQLEKELSSREVAGSATTNRVAELEKALSDSKNAGKSAEEKLKALWDQVAAEKTATEAALRRAGELEKAAEAADGELASLRAELEAGRKKLTGAGTLSEELDRAKKLLGVEKERGDALDLQLAEERKKGTKSALAQQLAEALKEREDIQEEVVRLRTELAQARNDAPAGSGRAKPKDNVEEKIRLAAGNDTEEARKRMGDILVDAGVITGKQLEAAIEEQREFPTKRLGAILVEKKFASEDVVAQALAFQRNVEFVRIKPDMIDTAAARLISGRLAEHHGCIPVSTFRGKMTLAMINPLDLIAIEDVERASNHQVDPVVATTTDIMNWIREIYD